jgi:hypothetical protein
MNFRTLGENDLADFAENVKTLLGGTDLAAIDPNVRADLESAIGTLPATLDAQTGDAFIKEDERKAAISSRNVTRGQVIALMSQVRDALRAGLAPKKEYDLCGFDYPKTPPSTYVASDPTALSAFGYSNGVIRGRFSGNNKPGRVTYEIWRREGDEGPWGLHMTTRRQNFMDAPVIPGRYYEYKVRATAAKSVSNFSNSAVVYGML